MSESLLKKMKQVRLLKGRAAAVAVLAVAGAFDLAWTISAHATTVEQDGVKFKDATGDNAGHIVQAPNGDIEVSVRTLCGTRLVVLSSAEKRDTKRLRPNRSDDKILCCCACTYGRSCFARHT